MDLANQTTLDTSGGIESPVAMDDTIADAWKDISQRNEAPSDNIARDTTGRFQPKEPVTDVVDKIAPTGEEEVAPVVEGKKAPSSWRKDAQDAFATLPAHVQDEVLKRETDFHKGVEGYKTQALRAQEFDQAFAPYMQTIQKLGATPLQAIDALMKTDHTLRYAPPAVKTQELLRLAHTYGIDLGKQHDPEVAKLQEKIYQLEQSQTTLQSSNEQRELAALTSEVELFSSGKEHFGSVQNELLALLPSMRQANPQSSHQEVLQMAYDRAVYANPQTRALEFAKQQDEARKEAVKKANDAKKASSTNVTTRGVVPAAGAKLSMDDQIRADAQALGLI